LITRKWWANDLPRFDVYISRVVLDELAAGDPDRAAKRLELVKDFPLLRTVEEVEQAAEFYVRNLAMLSNNRRDAFHLAFASVHEIE